jgi:hypothetical protein
MQMRSSTLVVSAIAIMLAGSISGCTQDDGDATTSSEHAEEACAEQLDTSPDTPVFGIDWCKTANCSANFAGLTAMAVGAGTAAALASAVVAQIAVGAGIGTLWADVTATLGAVATAQDIGAAAALLIEKLATFKNAMVAAGGTAAALGISQYGKDTLDWALGVLSDYATGWVNYWKCCAQGDATACPNMPFNVF